MFSRKLPYKKILFSRLFSMCLAHSLQYRPTAHCLSVLAYFGDVCYVAFLLNHRMNMDKIRFEYMIVDSHRTMRRGKILVRAGIYEPDTITAIDICEIELCMVRLDLHD